jgi:CRISPR-associated protein Cas5h
MKVLTFDLYGDFAHFRKYFTTTSPLTFSFPPPPTISGILGAIYGTPKNENQEVFGYENCKIALQIQKPVKKNPYGVKFYLHKKRQKILSSNKR